MWIWRPVVDGDTLPGRPSAEVAAGSARGIALVAGNTVAETLIFEALDPTAARRASTVLLELFDPATAKSIRQAYEAARPDSPREAIDRAIMLDERWGMINLQLLDAQVQHARVWRYRSDFLAPWLGELAGTHGGDMPLFLGRGADDPTSPTGQPGPWRDLAEALRASLVAFVQGRDPQVPGLPEWPEYETKRRATMLLDISSRVVDDPNPSERTAWPEALPAPGTWWPLKQERSLT
jgi:para-nitrobenzyl esterase